MSRSKIAVVLCSFVLGVTTLVWIADHSWAEEDENPRSQLTIPPSQEDDPAILARRSELVREAQTVDLNEKPWLVETARLSVNHPALLRERTIWAKSVLYNALSDLMPAIEVEKWLTPVPDLTGKFVLVEVWATWCPPCRRSLPYLNFIANKYRDDLVVVAICETDEEAIAAMPNAPDLSQIQFALAVDTGRRFANALEVWGIPHAVLLEPIYGGVVWEGMPTLPVYPLDDVTLEKFFEQARQHKANGLFPKESPVKFVVSAPTDDQRATRRDPGRKDVVDEPGLPVVPEEVHP